jgi:hypothetical protein
MNVVKHITEVSESECECCGYREAPTTRHGIRTCDLCAEISDKIDRDEDFRKQNPNLAEE